MREIKFRAWNAVSKDMVVLIKTDPIFFLKETPNWQVMQFTGLKDKNGTDIYEGDIVRFVRKGWQPWGRKPEDLEHLCVVFWDNENARFSRDMRRLDGKVISSGGPLSFKSGELVRKTWCEVIGNIYETPELLK